jgi:hypothetical protein
MSTTREEEQLLAYFTLEELEQRSFGELCLLISAMNDAIPELTPEELTRGRRKYARRIFFSTTVQDHQPHRDVTLDQEQN